MSGTGGGGAVYVWSGQLASGSYEPIDADGVFTALGVTSIGDTLGVGGDVNGLGRDDLAVTADNGKSVFIWPADAL